MNNPNPEHHDLADQSEQLRPSPSFELVVGRHADYHMDEEHPEQLGHLTEKGEQQAKELGEQVLEQARKMGGKLDISFIASSQKYDSPKYPMYEDGGRRAEETATEAIRQIIEHDDELQALDIKVASPLHKEAPEVAYNDRLTEGDIYYIPFKPGTTDELNENPMGYIKTLRERHGKDWKETHLQGSDPDSEAVAREIGAETSADIGRRAMTVVEDVAKLAQLHSERNPDRKMIFVLVAHDGVVRSLLEHELGVEDDSHGYLPSHAESVRIHIEDGIAKTEFKGKEYQALISA